MKNEFSRTGTNSLQKLMHSHNPNENPLTLAAEIGGLILITNLFGFAIYKIAQRKNTALV